MVHLGSWITYSSPKPSSRKGLFRKQQEVCDEIRAEDTTPTIAARWLVAWAINASGSGGVLTENQGKKLAISAIKVCRDLQGVAGQLRKSKANPMDKQIQQFGVVANVSAGRKGRVGRRGRKVLHRDFSLSQPGQCFDRS